MDPAFVAEFAEAFTAECANAQTRTAAAEAGRQKELEKIRRKLDQLVDAITSGPRSVTLESKLVELEERRGRMCSHFLCPGHPMPHKHNADRRHHIPKISFKVQNWSGYEVGLRQRGSLTLWIEDAALECWQTCGPSGQARYSDAARPDQPDAVYGVHKPNSIFPRAESQEYSESSPWNTTPRSAPGPVNLRPWTVILPSVCSSNPATMFSTVVLPQPLVPGRHKNSPS
jgi:hypothetical protein